MAKGNDPLDISNQVVKLRNEFILLCLFICTCAKENQFYCGVTFCKYIAYVGRNELPLN